MPGSDVLVVGTTTPVGSLDPRTAQDYTSHLVLAQVFEPPFRWRGGQTFEPNLLAGRLRMQTGFGSGAIRWQGKVREGVAFSDGTALETRAVVDALERVGGGRWCATGRGRNVFIETDDGQDPTPWLAHSHAAVLLQRGEDLVGTGPYRIEESDRNETVLAAWPGSHRPAGASRIVVRCYPPNAQGRPTALLAALERGEVDYSVSLSRTDAQALSGVRKFFQPGLTTALLWLNCEQPHFADPVVRRAVAAAVDPYALAGTCYDNPAAFVASSVLPRPMAVPGIPPFRHSPDRAREMLAASGGTLPPVLRMLLVWGPRPYLPRPHAVAACLAEQLSALGTNVDVRAADGPDDYLDGIRGGDYDLVLGGWIADSPDPDEFLRAVAASDRIPASEQALDVTAANYARYRNPEYDGALTMRAPLEDRVRAALEILVEDVPLVPVMHSARVTAVARRVEGVEEAEQGIVPDLSRLRLV